MSNIPKEPGFYPVIYWCDCKPYGNEDHSHEVRGVVRITRLDLDSNKFPKNLGVMYLNPEDEWVTGIPVKDVEFGPKIEHPKGGWPTKKEKK